MAPTPIYAILKQKPYYLTTNRLKAYLSIQASSLSAFVISKTHISGQKPRGRQLNTKVCGSESAIFRILSFFYFRYNPANFILVGHGFITQLTRRFLFLWKWVWLATLAPNSWKARCHTFELQLFLDCWPALSSLISTSTFFFPPQESILIRKCSGHKQHSLDSTPWAWWLDLPSFLTLCMCCHASHTELFDW